MRFINTIKIKTMRVFNTPFNSPLNNTGDPRIETRTRTEVGSGSIKTSGGGRSIDCKDMSKKNIDQYKKWFKEFKDGMNAYNKETKGKFRNEAFYLYDANGDRVVDEKKSEKQGYTVYRKSTLGRNFYEFGKNIRKDLCKAKRNLMLLRDQTKRKHKEAFYNIEYNRLYEHYSIKKANEFKDLNKELVRTITEQREIVDATKSQLPTFKEAWENNKDGVRSRFDTYEDFEVEAVEYCKKFPEKCKGGSGTDGSEGGTPGSVSDWRVISDTTTERTRT
tara:strand:+ start:583 stop:1413 length:831 start_codon:yes stop_codon:yes gene_type:complete